jgi:hypothetical protein
VVMDRPREVALGTPALRTALPVYRSTGSLHLAILARPPETGLVSVANGSAERGTCGAPSLALGAYARALHTGVRVAGKSDEHCSTPSETARSQCRTAGSRACVTLARAQTASRIPRDAPAVEHALEGTRRAQRSEHAGPNNVSIWTGEHHYNLSRERNRQLQEQATSGGALWCLAHESNRHDDHG